jgi:hypothetical protein
MKRDEYWSVSDPVPLDQTQLRLVSGAAGCKDPPLRGSKGHATEKAAFHRGIREKRLVAEESDRPRCAQVWQ